MNKNKCIILLFSFCLTAGGGKVFGAVVKHTFEVYYISGAPDGVFKNNVLGINGQFPGPPIEAMVGDTVEVTLVNKIQDGQNLTIHWHGIQQKNTPFEDGTSMITNCPLPYGSFQIYRFQVSEPGTFMYHSHVNSQYTEGLFGALFVYDPQEHYHYDGEMTIVLNDWYHRSAHENEAWFMSKLSTGLNPYPDSSLINGFGRYPCDLANLQNRSCSITDQQRPVFTVQQNSTYRIRVINAAALAFFNFSIDGHVLEAIEADGVEVATPVPADVAPIAPGQRYSFLLRTHNISPETHQENNRFLIRSVVRKEYLTANNGDVENINKFPQGLFNETTAVLQLVDRDLSNVTNRVEISYEQFSYEEVIPPPSYSKNMKRIVKANIEQEEIVYLDDAALLPLDGIHAPEQFDQEYTINGGTIVDENGITRFNFNSTPFHLPHDKPLLFSLIEDGKLPEESFPLEVANGSVVQVVINTVGSHPFHLHGHFFWVVGIGQPEDGHYNPSLHQLNMNTKRDTVVSHKQSWAVIRFIADNPGVWSLHCHMDWHNLSGMAVTIVEAADIVRNEIRPTPEALRICRLHN